MQTAKEVIESIDFKAGRYLKQFEEGDVHVLLFIVLLDMAVWHHHHGYTMTVTDLISTIEEDELLQRESDAHRTKRAADLRSRHMESEHKALFIEHFNNKYKEIASISRSDLQPRLVVEHGEGDNRHFHVALNFKYRITE